MTPQKALAIWQATLPQYDIGLAQTPIEEFWIDTSAWLMEPILFTAGRTAAASFVRPAGKIGDGYNNIIFMLFQRGRYAGDADGRPYDFGEGEVCVMDAARPFGGRCTECQYVLVNVSRDVIRRLLPHLPDFHGRVLNRAGGRILAEHFSALARYLPQMNREEALRITQATLTLMAASLGELYEGPANVEQTTASAIRRRVERYIDRNLASPTLLPETISQDLEISRSTLYRAFSVLGGVSNYVQTRRLDAARALLFHPEEHRSIGQIADALGFENQASFSKAFRRRFGCSPREARLRGSTRITSSQALFESWSHVLADADPKSARATFGS
ncbi:helix-turn-helix domain-containing protein [uncultured Aureimonas sp.]|uniref:helix-turn-helix domain-containing protein n=1 Tax=uncultured Aureimonas sp. TaxID=1604662 RepID=UPI0025D5116E|nr:helix-turn-helix domain-containing protein [uncultured Aureimonas sp.]